MISSNVDEVLKSLNEYKLEVERKLKHMVSEFAQDVAISASSETVKGDEARLAGLYKRRMALGIAPYAGFHKGAWTYTEGNLTFDTNIYSTGEMVSNVIKGVAVNYKIGDTFHIAAKGPAYEFLERRDGIVNDAMKTITSIYQLDLQRHYKEG